MASMRACLTLLVLVAVSLKCARGTQTQLGASMGSAETEPASPWQGSGAIVASSQEPLVCFVVRTYYAHGVQYGDGSLGRLLKALKEQTYPRWQALLMVLDQRPFPDMAQMVREQDDDRISVYAEWAKYQYKPKESDGSWAENYHRALYNLTDEAIRACPDDTTWVVVTNGDNLYDPHFTQTLVDTPPQYDAVAFDFYSRYQRPTAIPCERFADSTPTSGSPPLPRCKENELGFCQTDLAATGWRFQRFVAENRRFMVPEAGDCQAADGVMAAAVTEAGWQVWRVSGRCLVSHAPNPQMCAMQGGVWDDSIMADVHGFGGACISKEAAQRMLADGPSKYEVVKVKVTFDPQSFDFQGRQELEVTCVRTTDKYKWAWNPTVFGRVCMSRVDMDAFPHALGPHPWDSWIPAHLGAAFAARREAALAQQQQAA